MGAFYGSSYRSRNGSTGRYSRSVGGSSPARSASSGATRKGTRSWAPYLNNLGFVGVGRNKRLVGSSCYAADYGSAYSGGRSR